MKSEFKAKYLQHLVRKHKGNEGFTLIELLVVIIIVGVLAAIALPSFLNQIGKARGSEAKSVLGTLNRGQQAYRLENGAFTTSLDTLDSKVTGKLFTYAATTTSALATDVNMTAAPATGTTDTKGYSSRVAQDAATNKTLSIICETATTSASAATVPTGLATGTLACAGTDKEVK